MKATKHFREQPFVVFVAFAALFHSTWSIGTYMSGEQPALYGWESIPAFLGWLLPALALAVSMDIGQVVTAGEIRAGNRSAWLLRTFGTLAVFSYILQFLYMLHHFPALHIGTGASPVVSFVGSFVSQACVFILPAILPGATILYTLAHHDAARATPNADSTSLMSIDHPAQPVPVSCPECDWSNTYSDEKIAQRGLAGHMRAHSLLPLFGKNGKR